MKLLFLLNRSASAKYPAPKDSTILRADIHADSAHLSSLLAGHRFDVAESHRQSQTLDVESNLLWDKIIDGYEKAFQ